MTLREPRREHKAAAMSLSNKTKNKKNAFGATAPPFIDYLKEILRRYPDGGQILKELVQNADDAGASNTVFIHDERRYGTNSVWSNALGKYQACTAVKDLGVIIDPSLSFESHVNNITRIVFFHLRNTAKIRNMMSLQDAEKLVHAFVTSRLDYCNALLSGCASKCRNKLQLVQNAAARVLTRSRKYDHITSVLISLHWLPIKSRIDYKILLLTYKALNSLTPQYLSKLLYQYNPPSLLRSKGAGYLLVPQIMKTTAGPALYAFNDADFTEEDWKGIQRAGRSIKHDDPTKVGRFGIGFNSVYHVTDLPCVFSSKYLAIFDPQKLMFDDEREGYRWSLDDEADRKHILKFKDQFKPFQDIINLVCNGSCTWDKIINEHYFKGTLFRFPLRDEASEISDNLYDSKKATQLFDSFIPDADISVLFLRSVSSISLLHIDLNGSVTIRMKVSTSSPTSPLQQTDDFRGNYVQGKTSFKTVSCRSPDQDETTTQWLVTACRLVEEYETEIDTLAHKLSLYPQVDVAFQCDEDGAGSSGRLSCFLPLPNNETNRTGLPVHINACFGLTDNRRYIKWQEEDQKNDESAKWNELLMKEVLPHVYLKMLQDGVKLSKKSVLPVSAVYKLWPNLKETQDSPRWHKVAVDLFQRLFKEQEIFSLAKNENKWVAASDAVFPADTDTDIMSAVFRLLIEEGENLVTVPEHVLLSITETFPNPDSLEWVTPSFVRSVLDRNNIKSVGKDEKLSILKYVLNDGRYEELNGLKLLPLSDGSFRSFTNQEEDTVLIDNEKFSRVLLPFCKDRFLPEDLNSSTVHHLRHIAMTNSKLYQLINLDANNVGVFCKKHLPKEWKETKGHVKWNSMKDDHPPKTWLKEFWKFLNDHWAELRDFIGMPLIPLEPFQQTTSTVMLARLEEKSTLIFQSSREYTLSDQIQKVVKAIGGTVIKKDECLKHHDIESYVLTPSPRNVLQILLNIDRDKVIRGIASTSIHEKEEFKTYISSLDLLFDVEQNLLSALPIFRLMSEKYVAIESKQAVILKSNPAIPKDLPVPDTIIQCANEADRRLLSLLKVELLDPAQLAIYLVDCIDANLFAKEDEQQIMTWILNHGQILFSQNEELLRKCKNLRFILTEQGERKSPSSVFDPTKKTFLDLFEEDFFPPQVYRSAKMLESLKQLGLQTKEEELSPANILYVASQIQKLHIHSLNRAFKKADVLVRILNENDLLSKFSEEKRQELLQLQWIPCENPNSVKMKNSQKRCLYKPTEIRASKYSAIVGHVMPLASDLNESICHKLDLYSFPPAEKVMENLCVLKSWGQTMASPDSDYEFKNNLHSTYKFMQENIEQFRKEMNNKSISWLWTQNEFVSPREVVLTYPAELDLSLYIKKVPEEFLQYNELLREFGVKETLADEEIEAILSDIKENIDDRIPPYGKPSELKMSIAILDWMRKNEKNLKDTTPVPVMAQNQNFTLQPLKTTVFCDISDDGLNDLKQDEEEFYVIHEEVLPVTAKWLKIPFLSTRILKPQIIVDEEEYEGIEQCGQTEPITLRIKNILKEYDDENDIFKELLQNAEDAGAITCGFMLDFRVHPTEGLIDEGMALCNGPCLWAFNNELFSEEDWKNIVRVGSTPKEHKLEKIGKFGLGFNAVYHLTDIPSILSGKTLLLLDPNVTHLEKHIKSKSAPGIKLDLFQDRLFRRFPGQFKSYQGIFGCDLSNSNQKFYSGTLIKLPFRTAEEACNSEISSKVYDRECINAFQQHLTDCSLTPLLFLKHMKSLSLQIFKQEPIETVLKISKEIVCSIKISNESHLQDIREALTNFDTSCHEVVDCFTATIVEIDWECAVRPSKQHWLVYSCFGTKDSLRMFELDQCTFSLPIGGVAVPLQKESDNMWSPDERFSDGQAFCFLPLPIDTGLPVHINGSFAVTSNRKALWGFGTKLEWNKSLLKDAVATAYITTLLELKKIYQNGNLQNYDYYTFWPDTEKVNNAFEPLVSAFYSAIVQSTNVRILELLSNGKTWCSFVNARFLDPSIQENETVGKLAMEVFLNYPESSYCSVPLPAWARNNFIRCGFGEMVKERTFSWFEFYQVVFKNLNKMEAHCRNVLILNAIDLNDHEVDKLLKSTACIPTVKTGTLQFSNKLVNPHGNVACLYEPEEGRFLDETKNDYFTPERIQRLSGLGMLNDVLPLEEVIGRANKISQVWAKDKSKAYTHLQCLFHSMEKFAHLDSLHWETLKHILFLPALGTNRQNKVMSELRKPSEIYDDQCHHLVNMTEFTLDRLNLGLRPDDPVLAKLGVMKTPPIELVLRQLKEAHHHVKSFENSELFNIAMSCYDYLNKYLLNDGVPTVIIEYAQSNPFVLIDGCFVNVQSVAMGGTFEEKPYLYFLPTILSKFEKLWNCVGIKSQFTTKQLVAVLQKMSINSRQLKERDLHVCLHILIEGLYGSREEYVEDCLIPDEKGVLTKSSKLKFNDSPWMPVQAGVAFCHKLIPREVACYFNVETTIHNTLKNHLVNEFSPLPFGQHEKLTVRIKNIIEAYPSKKDILKELLQNADDAEATEIHFVWDKRKHGTKKLFGEKWEMLQGPALCVYNNKIFSNEDLIGIQQLGEGGKHGTLGRTGKYGLGFNSVYQLTDCPCILTGDEYLCISDPNLKYVETGTRESPGCMYSMNEDLKMSFRDVYNTFLPENFPLRTGTMFRLPLRTEAMAAQSEISINAVQENEMMELFKALQTDSEELILFLKHITKIHFHEINKDGIKSNFLIEKKITEDTMEQRESFHNRVRNSLKSGSVIPHQAIYKVSITSGKKQSQWIIAEQYGWCLPNQEEDKSHAKIPQAGLAACLDTKPKEIEFHGRAFCSLPLPGETGLPVHVNGNFEVDHSRRDLWKEDGESLKTKWNQLLQLNTIAPLYADLLANICTNFRKGEPKMFMHPKSHLNFTLSYFPIVSKTVAPVWHEMINEIYQSISRRNLPVIPILRSVAEQKSSQHSDPNYTFIWSSVSKPDPTDSPYFTNHSHGEIVLILERTKMNLVPSSMKIRNIMESFKAAGQNDTCFLQKLANLHRIVHDPKEHISAILIKLGCMTIDHSFFLGLREFFHKYIQPELFNIEDRSAVLKQLETIPHSQFDLLSGDESDELQRFLQLGISSSKNIDEYQRMFKSLPLFQTICGKRQRINYYKNVFILKSMFQKHFPGLYTFDDTNCIFLKNNLVNENLSKCLDIKILEDLDYCVKFIIPSVHKLKQTKLIDLIRLLLELSQTPGYNDSRDTIVCALRDVRFIEDVNGDPQMASYFFDDTVELYKVMLSKEKFVPETFWKLFKCSTSAKSLLKSFGVKHEVSEEEVIEFAHQIESDARGHIELQVLAKKSVTLLKTALFLGAKKSSKLMQTIKTIEFILAVQIDPTLCNYHKAFAQKRDVVAIKGSLLEKQLDQQYLIWTSMPILPTKSLSTNELATLRTAGALDEPFSEQVIQNLKNISGSECRTEQMVKTRATVFKNAYAYLQSVPFNEALLADLPLVLVENDTSLVKASQVVLTLSNATEFRPYLYPIQPKHAMFAEFFKKIGVEERPTVSQLCTVLKEIYTECSDKSTLQPNQLATVQRAVQQLFCLIKEDGKLTHFPKDTLYLPSTDGKLYESSMLFFNDTFFQANRLENSLKTKLKLLVKLHQCHLTDDPYEHQKLLQLLPKQSQLKLLSGVISVNLVDGQVEHCDYGSSCEFSGWFQKRLSSREFLHGLMCLIREQSKGTISQTEAVHMCESTFGKIQIVCCQALHTELLLNHQPLEVLGQLLLCENMEDVERALEQHGVRNTVSDEKGLGFRPNPGTPIQEEWHDSLDMDPLNSFEKGEYVGFCKDELENEYVFAIVVECLDKHPGETRQNPSRYRIQIGDEKFIEVSSLDLYQFKREKQSAPDGNATCTDFFQLLSQSKPSQSEPSQSKPSQSKPSQSEPSQSEPSESEPSQSKPSQSEPSQSKPSQSKPSQSKPSQSKSSQFEPSPKKSVTQTLEEAKIEIDQSLEQIWKMSDEDKSKAIRRLYLRWHPDKNPDNMELSTEAFKYLMNRIDELQQGKSKCNTSTQSNTTHSYNFRDFYEKWNYEAKSHKRGRERFYQNNFRQQYNFWSHFQETPRPNKEEAKRWYRQAECDLNAAQNDIGCNVYPEWCLFKVHQAVEKALIATEFRRNGQHPGTASTITCLAQKISKYATYLNDLPNIVSNLKSIGVDAKITQYPNFYPPPHIPNDRFKAADAQEAVNIATKLLRKLEIYITE
ncbi:sacsin [Silurus meridionalis]|nr:sacsin [Silurus meridionalis]